MKTILTYLWIVLSIPFLKATACQGCPFDNDNGGGGSGGYDCNTYNDTIFVDASRPNNNGSGTSWATAKKHLRSALDIANYCDDITHVLVAQGTYKTSITSTNRDLTFFVGNDITIQGGYPPGGGNGIPNHVLYQTILNGELAAGIEAHHIMTIYGQSGTVSVSGFIFKNGFADGTGSIEIAPNIFMARDDGAAVYVRDNSDVNFRDCAFYNNVANDDGGAIFSYTSITFFSNSIFANNTTGQNGGGLYMQTSSTSTLTNCSFANNYYVAGGGGAIYNSSGSTINVYNTIIWGNTNSWNGGGTRNVWYSLIQDNNSQNGGTSTNNIYQDPDFIDIGDIIGSDGEFFTGDDGLRVCSGSICLNRGLNSAVNIPNLDITKSNRVFNSQVDLGPYEKENYPSVNGIPINGDSAVARVYSGITSVPLTDCKILSVLEPTSNINRQFKTVVKHSNLTFPEYNDYTIFVDRYYYLERIPLGNFDGKITLYFTDNDFEQFNNEPYSINNLPTFTNQNKSHLRIVKFPGTSSSYQPNSFATQPVIIDPIDSDISYNIINGIWTVTFDNTSSLGAYFVTTTYDYVFDGFGDFSDDNNWLNNEKPNSVLPSLNKIIVSQGSYCEFDEPIILKPNSNLIAE